ncbi:MAG TPA: branched-chain amino acid ABC transporter permease [Syntrophorhabdales bacterium]|nr:branched-chain amino acid ABC transporter permease [Syntrophorhabdales bacterium]
MFSGDIITPLVMGIMLGGLYALIALGLSMVFGVMRLINLAHGDLVVLGSYGGYALMSLLGLDPVVGLLISIPLMFLLGFAIQKYLMGRAFGISSEAPLIIAFGISLVLQNANQILWTPLSRALNTPYSNLSFTIGERQFPLIYLLDFTAGIIVMLALREFLTRTYLGRAITAASQDKKAAQLMGINTKRVYGYAFAIAMVSAAIAGVFLGMTFPFTPTSGVSFLTIAFGTVIIGGLGSMLGTFIGGIILGIVQTLGGYLFGSASQMLIVYVIVLVILAVRPQGLFGR